MFYAVHTRIELRRFFISFFCAASAGLSHPPKCWHNKRAEKKRDFLSLFKKYSYICILFGKDANRLHQL